MDLTEILGGFENSTELIKQIEAEIGREFVPRTEFNAKNAEVKDRDKQLGELKTQLDSATNGKADYEKQIAELTGKVSTYEMASLKTRIAHEMGLPYDLANRLSGEDEKALRADAESLAKLIPSRLSPPPLKSNEPPAADTKDAAFKSLLTNLKGE